MLSLILMFCQDKNQVFSIMKGWIKPIYGQFYILVAENNPQGFNTKYRDNLWEGLLKWTVDIDQFYEVLINVNIPGLLGSYLLTRVITSIFMSP